MADDNRKLTAERVLELAPGASLSAIAEMLARNTSTRHTTKKIRPKRTNPTFPLALRKNFQSVKGHHPTRNRAKASIVRAISGRPVNWPE
jgi:predicted nicotinamide N-methyase